MAEQPPKSLAFIKWSGIILIIFGALITGFLAIDSIKLIGGAESMTINQAAEIATSSRSYVRLTDANWQCDTIAYTRGRAGSSFQQGSPTTEIKTTNVIATNTAQSIAVLITLSGKVECDDLEDRLPSGFLYASETLPSTSNTATGRFLRNADTVLTMCGYCGLGNSIIGIVMGIFFALAGIGLMFIYMKKG